MDKVILEKLEKFLSGYDNIDDVVGVLACGSYVTGYPNKHSDLDVHLILKEGVGYRERGNRVVDGLLVEYFANTSNQINCYFDKDYKSGAPMSQTQFATGEIIVDKTGEVLKLKNKAKEQLGKKFVDVETNPSPLVLYSVWDMMDDIESMLEEERGDFDFIYHNKLNALLAIIFKTKKLPYNTKTVLGHLTNSITRKKYLLEEINDECFANDVITAISADSKQSKVVAFKKLAENFLNEYEFDIAYFTFKSNEDV